MFTIEHIKTHMPLRKPNPQELRLIEALFRVWKIRNPSAPERTDLSVEPMNDGGMGSLRLAASQNDQSSRRLESVASELSFHDADGTLVTATLNLDQDGLPFELDIWKTDFSPLIRVPDVL